jgi:methylmalonyl-CoA mutase
MNGAPDHLPLATEFPAATHEQWRKLADAVLKGARFEERLQSRTADNLRIEPLYARARDRDDIATRPPGARWRVLARVDHPDPAAANAQALADLEGGADGLVLIGAGSVGARGYGVMPLPSVVERVLDGVHLDAGISIEFDLSPHTRDLPLALAALIRSRGIAPATADIRFGFNLLGAVACNGGFPTPWSRFAPGAARLAADLAAQGFGRSTFVADGRIVHDAGGTEAQELAFALATAVAYLRAFESNGITLEDARRMIFFRLTADADLFLTVAKFRTLRKLWQRIEESCGLAPAPAFIAAETAWRTMTRNDPYTNILRATIAVVAAGLAGADAVTVLPFTAARGLAGDFARRVARNTQLILLDEANLARVGDPTAGTGWSEDLTNQLCHAAWTLFQEIEAAGGAAATLEAGLIQGKVAIARAVREHAFATGKLALIGANEFPDLGEASVAVLDVPRVSVPPMPVVLTVTPMTPMRLAEPFEALRDASDQMLAATGARPKLFLANLGTRDEFALRATFATNFFAAGGIDAVGGDGFARHDDMIAAFKSSGARLACLCASDEVYARDGAETAKALRTAGASHIFLAGEPGKHEAQLRNAGVEAFVLTGCDALAILRAAHE